jgi:hypothetical protein
VAVDRDQVVAGRLLQKTLRGRRIVFAAGAGPVLDLARLGRLQQGQTEFPFGAGGLRSRRRQRRNPAVGRIHDLGRARPGVFPGDEKVVVGAGDVKLGAALPAIVLAAQVRPRRIQFGTLRLGEELLVPIPGGTLQRRVGLVQPDALQIGVAPRRLQRRGRGRSPRRLCLRSLGQRRAGRYQHEGACSSPGHCGRHHRVRKPIAHIALPPLQSIAETRFTYANRRRNRPQS